MDFQDKQLVCVECGKEFTFTAGEQEFYEKKGFENEPKRCPDCRGRKRFSPRQFDVTCADCGQKTTVPFKPTGTRPVYCRDCYQKHKNE